MDKEERRHYEGLYFEMAKHFTTLNTAAILAFLAVADRVGLPYSLIFLFAFSLAGATVSMITSGTGRISGNPRAIGNVGMAIAVVGFFVGLLYSAIHALV